MNTFEKWVCGKNINGHYVVRQVFVRETKSQFIAEQGDTEINWLLGHKTRIHKLDKILFDSALEAIKQQIAMIESESVKLREGLSTNDLRLRFLSDLMRVK